MIKSLLLCIVLVAIVGGAGAYGGYKLGQKAPTMGDCVNAALGDK